MTRVDYDKLFDFNECFAHFRRRMRARPAKDMIYNSDALLHALVRPRNAIFFERDSGKRVSDVIWTTTLTCILVSKPFRRVLTREGFTGWSTYPVKVFDHEGQLLRGYAGLSVTGRAGPIDKSRSKARRRGPRYESGPTFQVRIGQFFKDDQWDGSDFCIPENWFSVIVTERVKKALQELNIPNVEFKQLSTYEYDC